jgi:hypothetical protein
VENQYVWLLFFLVKLGRGDRVQECCDIADKSLIEYENRWNK